MRSILRLTSTLSLTGALIAADPVPLGHPDFYPSPDRPIGWRGDRTGAFPGATPVTTWNTKTGENVVWKSRMPSPSWGQPIVVGEKVFVTADPNLLLCVNVHTGKIVWQKEVDHTTLMPPENAKKAKEELAFADSLFPIYVDACRDMEKMQALAKSKGFDGENLKKALLKIGSYDVVDRESSEWKRGYEFDQGNLDKVLTDPDLKAQFEHLLQLRKQYGFTFQDPRRGDNWRALWFHHGGPGTKEGLALYKRLMQLPLEFDIWPWPFQNWYSICTMTFASPCSDGKNVYVAYPNNQVASYDLNGTLQWMVWEHPPENQRSGVEMENFHTKFIASPFLVGDRLVVNQNSELRVYDTHTGKKIWSLLDPYKFTPGGKRAYRPIPEGWSPMPVRLNYQGQTLELISDGLGNLYRLADGFIVHKDRGGDDWVMDIAVVGDVLVRRLNNEKRKPKIPDKSGGFRLKVVSMDQVDLEPIWDGPQIGAFITPIVHDGKYHDALRSISVMTGEKIPTTIMKGNNGYCSPILAGDWIIGAVSDGSNPGLGVLVGPANKEEKLIINVTQDNTLIEEPEWFRKPYCGQTGPGFIGAGWKPQIGYSSFYAASNRLFFRSMGYLWCFGNPKQPFTSPANMPSEARVGKDP